MDFSEKYLTPILICFIGIITNIIKMENKYLNKPLKQRIMLLISGSMTSAFLCWLGFESALYFTQNHNFSLAIGGFFAWRGADWVTNLIDEFVKYRILKNNDFMPYKRRKGDFSEIDYSQDENDLSFDENGEIDYSKGE